MGIPGGGGGQGILGGFAGSRSESRQSGPRESGKAAPKMAVGARTFGVRDDGFQSVGLDFQVLEFWKGRVWQQEPKRDPSVGKRRHTNACKAF